MKLETIKQKLKEFLTSNVTHKESFHEYSAILLTNILLLTIFVMLSIGMIFYIIRGEWYLILTTVLPQVCLIALTWYLGMNGWRSLYKVMTISIGAFGILLADYIVGEKVGTMIFLFTVIQAGYFLFIGKKKYFAHIMTAYIFLIGYFVHTYRDSIFLGKLDLTPGETAFITSLNYLTCVLILSLISYGMFVFASFYARSIHENQASLVQYSKMNLLSKVSENTIEQVKPIVASLKSQVRDLSTHVKADHVQEVGSQTMEVREKLLEMSHVVNNLRVFTRTISDDKATWCNLSQLLQNAYELVEVMMKRNHIQFIVQGEESSRNVEIEVLGKTEELIQALLNLLFNSIEAFENFPETGREILIQYKVIKDKLELISSDSGPGISSEHRERVLHPFYSTKKKAGGIGLSISASIIKAHGGTIDLDPKSTEAKFIITLPDIRVRNSSV